MNEKRFFENSGPYTLKKLSDHISGKLDSLKNSEVVIEDIASLKNAKSMGFCRRRQHRVLL